jgi:large subunit ribosomal protein L24
MRYKKGDQIKITAGKDKGKVGKIDQIIPSDNRVLVMEVNQYIKHIKPQNDNKGGRVNISRPIDVAKISLLCPKCGKETRIGYLVDKNNEKSRICKKCKSLI